MIIESLKDGQSPGFPPYRDTRRERTLSVGALVVIDIDKIWSRPKEFVAAINAEGVPATRFAGRG